MGIGSFVKAYSRQMEKEYEAKGAEYEVDEDAFAYLECQQTYYNNQMVSFMHDLYYTRRYYGMSA
jgi:hypothetical protein